MKVVYIVLQLTTFVFLRFISSGKIWMSLGKYHGQISFLVEYTLYEIQVTSNFSQVYLSYMEP